MSRLGMIEIARNAGFTLTEIKVILDADVSREVLHSMCEAKLVELDERIAEAQVAKIYLQHTLACPIPNPLDCPTMQAMLVDALPRRKTAAG